ncbi:MAG TPA: NAD-dependent succinate-semialdehyde dehydrogenase [Caldithrix abyssi]|uniref:NAD-dependent succinate-semialdehyde dehydrogenase n=1 Tax=Caldithrix abyssi TaxID=187145 RepID=A0A7V5LI07_CALAY|nr:NAD-dependent succinate-semialdehyde dehydrogenase [Caldithrix abyssi]
MKAINPATNEILKEYPEHTLQEVKKIINQVQEEFHSWRQVSFVQRASLMKKAANILRQKKEEFALLITREMGKVIRESRAEVEKCAWVCDYYAENAEKFLAKEYVETDAKQSYIAYEPLGIVLAIMPWNFPFWQVFRFAAPALMAGNAGLLKHASNVPGCALAIENVFKEAGFPENLFRTLLIKPNLIPNVIQDVHVQAVTLTGSEPAGAAVASIAGKEIKKTVLELGGSDPFIVLEDADLDKAISTAVQARMINTGQSCIAAKRFIVVDSVLKTFETTMVEKMSALRPGNPEDENVDVGPLARPDLVKELDLQVKKSIEKGAKLLLGGKQISGNGNFYEPTVFTNVKKGMPVYEEETFGPVAAIIPVQDEDEALAVANDSRFGLGASLWTQDIEKAKVLAREIRSGSVFINGLVKSDPRLPFGGIKKSGYGRELSYHGIREFVNIKTVWIGS